MLIGALVFFFGSLSPSLSINYPPDDVASWEDFKAKFSRKYKSIEEGEMRQTIFMKNLKEVRQHNLKYDRGDVSYTIGINKFSDLTPEELQSFGSCMKWSPEKTAGIELHQRNDDLDVPQAVDWRTKGVVTPVKDQGTKCGSCWAFSTTGSLEGQHAIKTKKLVSLSEQNLVDCVKDNDGCDGGFVDIAFKYITRQGIDTEESYPYEAKDGKCRFNPSAKGATDKGFKKIEPDEDVLKAAVSIVGPISVGVDASDGRFKHYTGGLYNSTNCNPSDLNHSVLIVGYGTTPKGEDYWIVKNSWGDDWGEGGYIRMLRHVNLCGIANAAYYPIV